MHIQRHMQSLLISFPLVLTSLFIIVASVLTSNIHTYAAEITSTGGTTITDPEVGGGKGDEIIDAVDPSEWPYHGIMSIVDKNLYDNDIKAKIHKYDIRVYSKYPLYVFHNTSNKGYYLKAYNPDKKQILSVYNGADYIRIDNCSHEVYDEDSGNLLTLQSWLKDRYFSAGINAYHGGAYISCSTDLYVFDTDADAKAYFETGDTSGAVQEPDPEYKYDYDHDFRKDEGDPDIPVPELKNLTHNGFHVDNADPSRDIEIYMTSTFYGLEHSYVNTSMNVSGTDSYVYYKYDPDWVWNTHRFNLINTDISYSDADIDIKKMFGVDNVGALVEDFKSWSGQYPSHKILPDYTFMKYNSALYDTNYKRCHVYSSSVGSDDAEKIKLSGQASTTYYVRFCQYVPDEGYTYGKWVSYTYKPNGLGARDDGVIGGVDADPDTGDPVIRDPVTGKIDPDTGDIIIDPTGGMDIDFSDSLSVLQNALSNIKQFITEFTSFSEFLASAFTFIPSAIWMIIFTGISLSLFALVIKLFMAIAGLIK